MKARPISIQITAGILFLLGPVYLAYWALQSGGDWPIFLETTNPVWGVLLVSGVAVAVGVWTVRPWGYYAFLGFSATVLLYQVWQYFQNPETPFYMALAITLPSVAAATSFLREHVSAPYFNPKMRWWERDPRFRINMGARFQVQAQRQKGSLLDISKGGCFAELDTILFPGDVIELRVTVDEVDFLTRAKVIWRCSHPRGYGLMFYSMTPRQRREVQLLLDYVSRRVNTNLPPLDKRVAA
jgi:hypothetical protein